MLLTSDTFNSDVITVPLWLVSNKHLNEPGVQNLGYLLKNN